MGDDYTRIEGTLGELELEVESNEQPDVVEDTFERVWEKRLNEAAEAKAAIRKQSNGYE